MDQAVKYIISFDDIFEKLLEDPFLGRQRQEIRSGLRSIIKEQYIVFYRVLEDRIRIVRIFNAERDLPRQYFQ